MSDDIKSGDELSTIVIKLQNRISELEASSASHAESFSDQFTELREELKIHLKLFKKTTHINTCTQLITKHNKEIAELKKKVDGDYDYIMDYIAELKEDCKDYRIETRRIEQIYKKNYNELKESHELQKEYNTIKRGKIKEVLRELKKLFQSADFMAVSGLPHKAVFHRSLDNIFKELKSGGETIVPDITQNRELCMKVSKPPEPKIIEVPINPRTNTFKTEPIRYVTVEHDGNATSEVKLRLEPREDDLCPICGTFLEPDYFAEYVKKFEVVKREDLQQWKEVFKIIKRHWMSAYVWTVEEGDIINNFNKRIKEEYKI